MTEYLLLFRNASAENGYLTTTEDMAADMPAWQSWIGNIASQGRLVHTAPVSYESLIVSKHDAKAGPHKETGGILISGFLICKAEHIKAVEDWGKSCPILKYPHSSVEIRPLIPFPAN
jgi:hypothetical protein